MGAVLRHFSDSRFIADHPEFAQGSQPFWLRMVPGAMFLVVFLLGGFAMELPGTPQELICLVGMFVVLMIFQKLLIAAAIKRRIAVPLESDLGQSIPAVVASFGFQPKRIVLIPHLMANGAALPDGTVLITTSLTVLLSQDEISAVLAHELSHARDRDAKRIRAVRLATLVPTFLVLIALGILLTQVGGNVDLVLPLITLAMPIFLSLASWPLALFTQKLEYKCDADVAALGIGNELASALDKLYRFLGTGYRWVGWDRFTLSHPSTDLRIEALRKEAKAEPPPVSV